MNLAFLVVGVVVLVVTLVDMLWTALWVDGGAGPLSARLSTAAWHALRTVGDGDSRSLSLAGPLILVLTLVVWVGLIWVGWTLVFGGAESALVYSRGDSPVTWANRSYFVAYSMFTMGNGDYYPSTALWEFAASLTTATGMLSVTMAVSYVLSVLSAVVEKRSFASSVSGLGEDGEDVVETGWGDDGFRPLELPVNSLASDLDTLAAQHKAYPILHYYHSDEASKSSPMAVAVFDEALTLLRFGVPEDDRLNEALVESGRSAAKNYTETLDNAFIEPAEEAPKPPDLDRLRRAGIPTVDDGEFAAAVDDLGERRRTLLGAVRADAWYWPPVNNE
ncbi:potassium channel family protein [Halobacterium sp. R2-5]|uniref:potassium channel family protein n=1 Tax=Halobacterium sp. R2-5 TaxID=2715751 RepID=UPI0014235F70|nr:potassium channel family protein [Halobacterium sp. R2-5]NIB99567.1 two pore domain potassium channel family protein [Halobacterium sp. R2-5]